MPAMRLEELVRRLERGRAVVAGVLSGTSADGIDVVLTRLEAEAGNPPEALAFAVLPFEEELHTRVRALLDGRGATVRELALLDRDLGRAFGAAARQVADGAGLPLDLVGSHGQTIYHHDGREPSGPATLQLGDGDHVARAAGAFVASDFRQADVAAGGEGAPISALADALLFAALTRPAAVLNLGGMANLSLLGEGAEVGAFDVGPAGSLLDGLSRRLLDRPWDEGGAVARGGTVLPALLERLLAHPFLRAAPPKSTGRDTFGEPWIEELLAAAPRGARPPELLATAVEFVACAVADALRRWSPPVRELVVAGGGARNLALVESLARRCGVPVGSSRAHGVDPDAREALVFAVLAARTARGIPSSSPAATGARRGAVLGKLSAPPQGGAGEGETPPGRRPGGFRPAQP